MTILIFIIVLSILVFVHEFGHFWVAKKEGLRVEEFGFGFPPRLFGLKKGETIYSINLIPFGGFVKIFGENGEERQDPRSFSSKGPGTRSLVAVAGVVMNVLLAMILLIMGNFLGLRVGLDEKLSEPAKDVKIQVIQVALGSPAENVGLRALDEILQLSVPEETLIPEEVKQIQDFVKRHGGKVIDIKAKRGSNEIFFKVLARANPPPGQGALGVSLAKTGVVSYPWYLALLKGIENTFILTANTIFAFGLFFKSLFVQGKVLSDVAGPIGIAVLTGQAASLGMSYLIQFVALLSINLAVLNLIPFPALDGGRFLFLLLEKIVKHPLLHRLEVAANAVGLFLLIILMVLVTVKDVGKLIN